MILYTDGHPFHYEMENLCRVFFPEEQIKTVAADEPGEPHVTTALRETAWRKQGLLRGFFGRGAILRGGADSGPAGTGGGGVRAAHGRRFVRCAFACNRLPPAMGHSHGRAASKLMNRLTGQYGAAGAQAYFQNRLLVSPEKTALAFDVAQAEKRIMDTSRPESFSSIFPFRFVPHGAATAPLFRIPSQPPKPKSFCRAMWSCCVRSLPSRAGSPLSWASGWKRSIMAEARPQRLRRRISCACMRQWRRILTFPPCGNIRWRPGGRIP